MTCPSEQRPSGSCYCGAVGYSVEDAFDDVLNCHCSNCRRTGGSAFRPVAGMLRDRLVLTQGADRLLIHGNDLTNNTRCPMCGSLLHSVVRAGPWVHLAMGKQIDAPTIRPTAHILVGSMAAWHQITDDLPQYRESPQ